MGDKMKYEIIIFDADETLFDFRKSEKEAFKNTMLEFGVNYDENYHLKIYQDINTAIWKEFEEGLITQEKLKIDRFGRLCTSIQLDIKPEFLAKAYMKHLADGSFLLEGASTLIEDLTNNYKLSIVTNGLSDVQNKRIRQSSIAHHFKSIIISEEAKVSKPNPEIFELALNKINPFDKSKVLMIGDSLTSDIQGGINFGIDTCWYNPNKIKNTKNIIPTYEVSTFNELKELLEYIK